MKKNILFIRLMTLFMVIVGLNAAVLVGYILIYPQLNGGFSRGNMPEGSKDIISAQADTYSQEALSLSPENYQNGISIREEHTEEIGDNTLSEDIGADYSPAKQAVFEDLAHREQLSGGQNQQIFSSGDSDQVDAISKQTQTVQDHYTPLESTENSYMPEQNTSEINYQNSTDVSSAHSSGNANNFYTHDNPHLQQTTDAFVLNTDSKIFHLPKCNDVRRMAEKNYATSNSSFYDLEAQGYKHCGHCLKNYTIIASGNSSGNTYSNTYDNSVLQQDAETSGSFTGNAYLGSGTPDNTPLQQDTSSFTYIINTSTRYFHIPNGCRYINELSKPEECISTNSSREELISQGYLICHRCFD